MSRIVVKNLPKTITEEKLRDIFSQKGLITDVQLKYTADGKFRQFAFIGYQNEKEAEDAIKSFNNTRINTTKITVEPCALLENEIMKHLREEEQFASKIPTALPQYCEILNQDSSYVVKLQDLDRLQEDLEQLLVRSAKKQRLLKAYIEDNKENKKITKNIKRTSRQRKLVRRTIPRPPKSSRSPDMQPQKPLLLLNNDFSKNFWRYVDTYCRDVTEEDIEFINSIKEASSQEIDCTIPDKGEHYSLLWDLDSFSNITRKKPGPKRKVHLDARGKERLQKRKGEVLLQGRNTKSILKVKNGLCLENGYKNYQKATDQKECEDVVLKEIEKCQQELEILRKANIDILDKLKEDALMQMSVKKEEMETLPLFSVKNED